VWHVKSFSLIFWYQAQLQTGRLLIQTLTAIIFMATWGAYVLKQRVNLSELL
jgi:hypothetical protein